MNIEQAATPTEWNITLSAQMLCRRWLISEILVPCVHSLFQRARTSLYEHVISTRLCSTPISTRLNSGSAVCYSSSFFVLSACVIARLLSHKFNNICIFLWQCALLFRVTSSLWLNMKALTFGTFLVVCKSFVNINLPKVTVNRFIVTYANASHFGTDMNRLTYR